MKTPWAWAVVALAVAFLVGYWAADLQPSGQSCIHCEKVFSSRECAPICAECLPEYTAQCVDDGYQTAQQDIGESGSRRQTETAVQ